MLLLYSPAHNVNKASPAVQYAGFAGTGGDQAGDDQAAYYGGYIYIFISY